MSWHRHGKGQHATLNPKPHMPVMLWAVLASPFPLAGRISGVEKLRCQVRVTCS